MEEIAPPASTGLSTPVTAYGPSANPYGRAFGIGAAAGMRSALAPFAVHLEARNRATAVLALAALGELVVDKLPATPSRTSPPALVARAISGAYCGRALALRFGGGPGAGAIAGVLGALVTSFAGRAARAAIVARTPLPDPVVALFEDGFAIAIAVRAQRRPADLSI